MAVGRAIVRKPKVFLFDEPLSNLDAKLRVQMRTEISKLHQKLEATIIYVTHDQTEAMTMGDRIVIMKDGVVNQIDTPLNVYNHPANKFVAGFIGSPAMNFLEGKISNNEGIHFSSTGGGLSIKLNENYQNTLNPYINKKIWMGIRPEDIYDTSSNFSQPNGIKMEVKLDVLEPMGNEIFLYFTVDDQQFIARTPAREMPSAGSVKNIIFDTDKLHFFDAETEKALN